MREVLAAHSDHDFITDAPRRRRAPPGTVKVESPKRRVLTFVLGHPIEIAVTVVLTVAASAISWNALVLQTARHPAPLFGSSEMPHSNLSIPLPPARPILESIEPAMQQAPAAELAPLPARPSGRDAIGDLIRFGAPPKPTPAPQASVAPAATPPARPVSPAVTVPSRPPAMRDTIGDLIHLGEPAPVPPGFVGKPEPRRMVVRGQQALNRLGYGPLKTDGIMGPDTQEAIERFERSRRLPVTGEFGPHTAHELAVRSGLPVD